MTYRVVWNRDAQAELQRIYDASLDKEGVVHAVVRIGIELANNPLDARRIARASSPRALQVSFDRVV